MCLCSTAPWGNSLRGPLGGFFFPSSMAAALIRSHAGWFQGGRVK